MASSSAAARKMNIFREKIDLINFRDPNTPHDRVIFVGKDKFYVQSVILSMSSEYFHGLFNSKFTEADQKEITIEDIDPVHFEIFLKMIYPPHLVGNVDIESDDIDTSILLGLMSLSHRFLCPTVFQEVKRTVDHIACDRPKDFNFIEFASIAVLHDLNEYQDIIIRSLRNPLFAAQKEDEIMKAPDHVTKFLLKAYMNGQVQVEQNGLFIARMKAGLIKTPVFGYSDSEDEAEVQEGQPR